MSHPRRIPGRTGLTSNPMSNYNVKLFREGDRGKEVDCLCRFINVYDLTARVTVSQGSTVQSVTPMYMND